METGAGIVVGFALMGALIFGATVTGNGQKLCDAMGGVYTPQPPPGDSCPGGKWRNLFAPKPAPTK